MTNADKIRKMSNGELAELMTDNLDVVCMCDYDPARCKNYVDCRDCWMAWLGEEADGADGVDKKLGDGR